MTETMPGWLFREAAVQPDPGDSLIYEECLAMQGPMPIGNDVIHLRADGVYQNGERISSMTAAAPGGANMWAEYLAAKREAADLELRSTQLLCERNNLLEECIGYVERISALEGRLTEAQTESVRLRECIGSRDAEYAELEAYGRARILAHQSACEEYEAMLARFTADPTPADLPDPPRRADGTLAPQGKPFPLLKDPSRRVGG